MKQFLDGKVTLYVGDCLEKMKEIPDNSVDSAVCDPPYHLTSIVKRFGAENAAPAIEGKTGAYARASRGFMGKQWDGGDIAFRSDLWREVFRVLKPGAYLLAFSGTRTYHRMACAIEDAGFDIRDMPLWMYGTGFPKSHDVSKGIDKARGKEGGKIATGSAVKRMIPGADQNKAGWEKNNGREYQPSEYMPADDLSAEWKGWGTALKPAVEPICMARKPLIGTVAENVLQFGTGAINVDGCRIETEENLNGGAYSENRKPSESEWVKHGGTIHSYAGREYEKPTGRWPANVIHDGSEEVVAAFPDTKSGALTPNHTDRGKEDHILGKFSGRAIEQDFGGDEGSAARFFYSAKADAHDRAGSGHPTVKPVDLMQYLVRLVTRKGGTVLDMFAGSGTTGEAAYREGMKAILIEREEEYARDIERRMSLVNVSDEERRIESLKARGKIEENAGPLFA